MLHPLFALQARVVAPRVAAQAVRTYATAKPGAYAPAAPPPCARLLTAPPLSHSRR